MSTKDQTTSAHGESEQVPDPIARLMRAQAFDIKDHRFDDFRTAAQHTAGQGLLFTLGKPGGLGHGIAVLTKTDAQLRVKLVIRRSGKTVRFARPTPEFAEPELEPFLELVHLVPVVDVTNSAPAACLWPFRITAWEGYERVFKALANLDHNSEGLYLRHLRGAGNDPGGYEAEPFPMEERHRVLWASVPWPRPGDLPSLIPDTPFQELLQENFNLRRAMQLVERRKKGLL